MTALVAGVVMCKRGSETLVVLTVDLVILGAGVVILDALFEFSLSKAPIRNCFVNEAIGGVSGLPYQRF